MQHRIRIPRVDVPISKIPENKKKSNYIIRIQFDYPYGSFEEYKKHVLAGEFDLDIKSVLTSPEEQKELDKAVKEGKLWVTY